MTGLSSFHPVISMVGAVTDLQVAHPVFTLLPHCLLRLLRLQATMLRVIIKQGFRDAGFSRLTHYSRRGLSARWTDWLIIAGFVKWVRQSSEKPTTALTRLGSESEPTNHICCLYNFIHLLVYLTSKMDWHLVQLKYRSLAHLPEPNILINV